MVRCENDYFAFSYNKNRYIGVEGDESVEVLDIKKQFKQIFFKQIFDVPLYYDTTIVLSLFLQWFDRILLRFQPNY